MSPFVESPPRPQGSQNPTVSPSRRPSLTRSCSRLDGKRPAREGRRRAREDSNHLHRTYSSAIPAHPRRKQKTPLPYTTTPLLPHSPIRPSSFHSENFAREAMRGIFQYPLETFERTPMKTCRNCQSEYDPYTRAAPHATWFDIERMEYCSEPCARQSENRRYYQSHKASRKRAPLQADPHHSQANKSGS